MGYIVNGYCHSDIAQARLHLADVSQLGGVWKPLGVDASANRFYMRYDTPAGSPSSGTGLVRIALGNSTGSPEFALTFPVCDSSLHDQFMPWAGAPSAGQDWLEANGVGILGIALIVFWIARIAGKQK